MNFSYYETESKIESFHWWFLGRRNLFSRIIKKIGMHNKANILEIGTSTGANLRMLHELGFVNVRGLDLSDQAIKWCLEKGLNNVDKGDICNIPSNDEVYDLVMATDILEHVDNDILAIKEVIRVLAPGGKSIITVPAFQSLWGMQDILGQHKRRYRKIDLIKKLNIENIRIIECYYFNYILFVPIFVVKKIINLFKLKIKSEAEINSPLLNNFFLKVFNLDVCTAKYVSPPFGVSILVLIEKS